MNHAIAGHALISVKQLGLPQCWSNVYLVFSVRALRDVVDRFIARANIAHFEDLLARETDPEQRRVIEGLLAQERQKLQIAEREARKESRQPSNPAKGDEPQD